MLMWTILIFLIGYLFGAKASRQEIQMLRRQLQAALREQKNNTNTTGQIEVGKPFSYPDLDVDNDLQIKSSAPIDNAVLLLYLGAFLFLSAVGSFLAFGTQDGALKSFLVLLLVVVFYAAGLYLFRNNKRLKPAGVAFIGLGMLLVPFFGLSLYVYVFDQNAGPLIWALTSVIGITLYLHAFMETRQVYISYFLLGAVISMFQSGVAIIDLPPFYYAWTLALTGMMFLAIAKMRNLDGDLQEPMNMSANVLVPASLLFSFFFIPVHGVFQLAMTFLIAAIYYGLAAFLTQDKNEKVSLSITANALGAGTIMIGTYHFTDSINAAALSGGLFAAFESSLLALKTHNAHTSMTRIFDGLAQVCITLALTSALFAIGDSLLFVVLSALFVSVSALLSIAFRSPIYQAISMFGLFNLPLIIGLYWASPSWTAGQFAVTYALLAAAMFALRLASEKSTLFSLVFKYSFYIALVFAAFSALLEGPVAFSLVSALLAVLFLRLSFYEPKEEQSGLFTFSLIMQVVAVTFGVYAVPQITEMVRPVVLPVVLGVLSAAHYLIGSMGAFSETLRNTTIRYSAIFIGLFASASFMIVEDINVLMAMTLLISGLFLLNEASKEDDQNKFEAALAICLLAVQWSLWQYDVRNLLIYTHMWALFFASLAVWHATNKEPEKENSYTQLALISLTVPLVLRSLGDQGSFYGWLLIVEHIMLILIGMMFQRPAIKSWGLWVTVGAVLYQLRALTYLALGFLAIILIFISLRVLQKSETPHEKKPHK
jgi:hypothetical protein